MAIIKSSMSLKRLKYPGLILTVPRLLVPKTPCISGAQWYPVLTAIPFLFNKYPTVELSFPSILKDKTGHLFL